MLYPDFFSDIEDEWRALFQLPKTVPSTLLDEDNANSLAGESGGAPPELMQWPDQNQDPLRGNGLFYLDGLRPQDDPLSFHLSSQNFPQGNSGTFEPLTIQSFGTAVAEVAFDDSKGLAPFFDAVGQWPMAQERQYQTVDASDSNYRITSNPTFYWSLEDAGPATEQCPPTSASTSSQDNNINSSHDVESVPAVDYTFRRLFKYMEQALRLAIAKLRRQGSSSTSTAVSPPGVGGFPTCDFTFSYIRSKQGIENLEGLKMSVRAFLRASDLFILLPHLYDCLLGATAGPFFDCIFDEIMTRLLNREGVTPHRLPVEPFASTSKQIGSTRTTGPYDQYLLYQQQPPLEYTLDHPWKTYQEESPYNIPEACPNDTGLELNPGYTSQYYVSAPPETPKPHATPGWAYPGQDRYQSYAYAANVNIPPVSSGSGSSSIQAAHAPYVTAITSSNFGSSLKRSASDAGLSDPQALEPIPVHAPGTRFRCRWGSCKDEVLGGRKNISQHLATVHGLAFRSDVEIYCQFPSSLDICGQKMKEQSLPKHIADVHFKSTVCRCPLPDCNSMISRKSSLSRHLQACHKIYLPPKSRSKKTRLN